MKRATTFILVGIIVVLAAALVGVLVFVKNQPVQERAFQQLVEIPVMEPDSELWGQNFPNQWTTFQKTETNNIDTTYGGSSGFSWLERDPRQVILFGGYGFSKDYNDDRGHMNALEDVRATKRVNETTPGTSIPVNRRIIRPCGKRWAWPPSIRLPLQNWASKSPNRLAVLTVTKPGACA